ncbi:hypothetical protein ACN2MM_10635 [Alkalilimnicola ehrlichii MLHE-1]|uniref:Uncharacterized protein n=1 Tax=Alkalilimnicola ehrlichii (strain ATCC BAA-1101 / DSM 17681 / MLHE-1) TaxID=187272 RepID=Q0A768_ALKEH|nr:hypothetical protein [Alkalilimnicola ehrlichii]ABI57319.1 hypothetical protein Mlg_1977 [Alkalilimnicola ehrlichii MLHE-1]
MSDSDGRERLPRRPVLRTDSGPFSSVKLELGAVTLLALCAALVVVATDLGLLADLLILISVGVGGGLWVAWRTRRVVRAQQRERDHGAS